MLENKSQAGLSCLAQGRLYASEIMGFPDRLRAARRAAKLTQKEVAKAARVTPQAVSQWERGEGSPEMKKLPIIAQVVGRSVSWLTEQDVAHIPSEVVAASLDGDARRTLAVKGYVGAGDGAHFYEATRLDEIDATTSDSPNAAALRIMGDSLGEMFDRWYVVFDDIRQPVTEDLIGKSCVVWLTDGRVLVKLLKRGPEGYVLISNAGTHPPIVGAKIEAAARVKEIRSG